MGNRIIEMWVDLFKCSHFTFYSPCCKFDQGLKYHVKYKNVLYHYLLPEKKKKFSLHLCVYAWSLSCTGLFVTLWTVAHQAPLSMGFSRQEYQGGLSCPPSKGSSQPRDRNHVSYLLHGQMGSLPLSHLGNPSLHTTNYKIICNRKAMPWLSFVP